MIKQLLVLTIPFLMLNACKNKKGEGEVNANANAVTNEADINNTLGFGVLKKLRGIWNGPVSSTTPLGGYPEWIVDFRPISENQIAAKNELDTLNDIFMSFFIAKYNSQYKVAFRNGGSFNSMKRVSYFLADSVSETSNKSYYRFSEILKGKNRAFTEVVFVADSLYIKSYTNKYNTQSNSTTHMIWSAKLKDTSACLAAINNFSFPKKTETKDFSTSFTSVPEAIFYSTTGNPAGDPYPENAQPYLGITTAGFSFSGTLTPMPSKKVFLIITTQPLFSGFVFNANNLNTRSRYVILTTADTSFTFNYMHPGTYYYYAFYDNDNNGTINSGDWISINNTTLNLTALGTTSASTQINFVIP